MDDQKTRLILSLPFIHHCFFQSIAVEHLQMVKDHAFQKNQTSRKALGRLAHDFDTLLDHLITTRNVGVFNPVQEMYVSRVLQEGKSVLLHLLNDAVDGVKILVRLLVREPDNDLRMEHSKLTKKTS